MNRLVVIALMGTLGATTACGSERQSGGAEAATPICKGRPTSDCVIPVANVPFVIQAMPITDGVSSARVRNPTPGTVCLSGTLADAGPTYANWGAILILDIAEWNQQRRRVSPFNAEALGITQVQFTIESPPATGVAPAIIEAVDVDCADDPPKCVTKAPFYLKSAVLTTSRTVTAALGTATQPTWGDPSLVLDPTMLYGLQFDAKTLQGTSVEYDFCIHDLKFLDVDGKEVTPAR